MSTWSEHTSIILNQVPGVTRSVKQLVEEIIRLRRLNQTHAWSVTTYNLLLQVPGMPKYKPVTLADDPSTVKTDILSLLEIIDNMSENNRGLILGQTKINRISGPVSYTLLFPQLFKFSDNTTYIMPIILTFGDYHYSLANECSTGVRLYDKSFIQPLDDFAVDYKVDFYTEFASDIMFQRREDIRSGVTRTKEELYGRFYNKEENNVIGQIRQSMYPCFFHEYAGREFYDQGCDAKHVRWHFADARMFNTDVALYHNKVLTRWFESIFYYFVRSYWNHHYSNFAYIKQFCESNHVDYLDLMQDFKTIVIALYDRDWTVLPRFIFGKYTQVSLIRHQLRASPFRDIWETSWFALCFSINDRLTDISRYDVPKLKAELVGVFDQIMVQKEILTEGEPDQLTKDFLVELTTPILDIYTLTRIMKAETASELVVMVLGDYHCVNMSTFLQTVGLSRIMSAHQAIQYNEEMDRCLEFDTIINMDRLMHKRSRLNMG